MEPCGAPQGRGMCPLLWFGLGGIFGYFAGEGNRRLSGPTKLGTGIGLSAATILSIPIIYLFMRRVRRA